MPMTTAAPAGDMFQALVDMLPTSNSSVLTKAQALGQQYAQEDTEDMPWFSQQQLPSKASLNLVLSLDKLEKKDAFTPDSSTVAPVSPKSGGGAQSVYGGEEDIDVASLMQMQIWGGADLEQDDVAANATGGEEFGQYSDSDCDDDSSHDGGDDSDDDDDYEQDVVSSAVSFMQADASLSYDNAMSLAQARHKQHGKKPKKGSKAKGRK